MHTLALEIDYAHEKAGWINCHLTIDGEAYHLDASSVFPPFQPLLRFVKAVAGQRFPAEFFWDEEGVGADFEATAVAKDSPLVHLKIKHNDSDTLWFEDVIERETIIQAFLPPILDFSNNCLLAEKEWYLSKELVAKLHRAIVTGIPLRSDIHVAQDVESAVQGAYDVGYVEGRVFFRIIFDEEWIISILMFDTNPFWGQAIDFFGQIASGNLPASCEHHRVFQLSTAEPGNPFDVHLRTRLVAEPLDVPENFRLKIFTTYRDEKEFLLLEEVVDRHTFTQSFLNSFQKFLKDEYQIFPDKDSKTFDLRTLSLEKLDQA